MFVGGLLVAILPGDLGVTFGEVSCPSRVVEVTVVNYGTSDERYALRVGGKVLRTEVIVAGTTVRSRVPLAEDQPTTIAVQTIRASVGSARRTADCVPEEPAGAGTKGEAPTPGARSTPPPKAVPGGGPAPKAALESAPGVRKAPEAVPQAKAMPAPHPKAVPAPAPKAAPDPAPGVKAAPGATEAASGAGPRTKAGGEHGAPHKAKANAPHKAKAKRKRGAPHRSRRRETPERMLPMTGAPAHAFVFTGAATAVTGGILTWYALLWPRRRALLLPPARTPGP